MTQKLRLQLLLCAWTYAAVNGGGGNQYNSNVKINPPEFRPAESTPDAAELATASQWEVSPRIYWSKRVKMINSFSNWE